MEIWKFNSRLCDNTKTPHRNTKNNIQCSLVRQQQNTSSILSVEDNRRKISMRSLDCVGNHPNEQARQLHVPPDIRRRLKIRWPTDRLNA